MSNYDNGSSHERRTKAKLEADGYWVMKSAGSKGVADLVAIKKGQILLVQGKLNSYVAPKEWNDLYQTALNIGALAIVVGRGQKMRRITDFKSGLGERQPWVDWSPDELDNQ
jgi:Holliday junction resolvase